MSNFHRNICYNTLIDQVSSLCSELVRQECKFSLSVKLEHFQFSLSSEKQVPARGTGKRPPSYMRRQIRCRENFLQRNSGCPSPKEDTEGDDKTSHMQEEGDLLDKKVPSPGQTTGDEIDNNISLDLTPHMAKGLLENSNVSEKDTDESNSDTEGGSIVSTEDTTNDWEQVLGRRGRRPSERRQSSPPPPLPPPTSGYPFSYKQARAHERRTRDPFTGKQRISIVDTYERHTVTEKFLNDGYASLVHHCVFAPANTAQADVERAMLTKDSKRIKLIDRRMYHGDEYEFSCDGKFQLTGKEIFP